MAIRPRPIQNVSNPGEVFLPRHKHVRLRDFSYASDSTYFITQVTYGRRTFLGEVEEGDMYLTRLGVQAWVEWDRTLVLRPEIVEHAFVVMPNHLHVLFSIDSTLARPARLPVEVKSARLRREPRSASSMMSGFKGALTRWVRIELANPEFVLWQPGFHEHVVKSQRRFDAIQQYIVDNPARWDDDQENPNRVVRE